MKKQNILFICKYNMFRSRVAEACFRKFNRNKNLKAKSAGIFKSFTKNPVQASLAKKYGLDIGTKSKGIDTKVLQWADIIVIAADDVPKSIFTFKGKYLQRIIVWKIKDENKNLPIIILKVKDLIKQLEKVK